MPAKLITCDLGDAVILTATFRDVDGALYDPTTVTGRARRQYGSTDTTLSVTRESVGVYTAVFEPDVVDVWHVRFAGTGGAKGAGEGLVEVRKSVFA